MAVLLLQAPAPRGLHAQGTASTRSVHALATSGTAKAGNTTNSGAATRRRPFTRTISGQVTSFDESTPLEGVLVSVRGTNWVSGSQQDGSYYIPVKEDDTVLVFSLNEFQTYEVRLTEENQYNIVLHKGFSPIGEWRGVFRVRPDLQVPFNFEIRKTDNGDPKIFFLNAEEKFDGGRVQQTADSLLISLDQFDNQLAFAIRGNATLSGVLRRQDGKGTPIPVTAETGQRYRFKETGTPPAGNFSGTYDITFHGENGKEEKAVGLLQQDGSKLRATFLRVTGDSRYLQGIVEGDHFYLSSFIGSGPSYYKGSFTKDGQLSGEIEGARGSQHFSGIANSAAALPDPYKLTYLKEGYHSFDFSFPDVDGKLISPKDEKYKNKVVIVTIGGTWCPNCVDEAGFLAPWYKANRSRGVEIIALQYERQTDPVFVKKVLTRQKERFGIEYDQVFAGIADKAGVAASLPALNNFLSFPTTIIIDKKGRVAEIHTGYTGPATGKYYEDFIKAFNEEIDTLLKS